MAESIRIGVFIKRDPRSNGRGMPIVEVSVEEVEPERLAERIREVLGGEATEVRHHLGVEVHLRNAVKVDVLSPNADIDPFRMVGQVLNGYLYVRARSSE